VSDVLGLFLVGVLYGSTTCVFSCMPYLGPHVLATGGGFRDGLQSSAMFLGGKLLTYGALSAAAAALGHTLFSPGAAPVRWVSGGLVIAAGLSLPFFSPAARCSRARGVSRGASLVALGAASGLIPCPPLLTLFTVAAGSGSMALGLLDGLAYGLGLTLSPLLLLGGALAMIARSIRTEARALVPLVRFGAAAVMVLLGLRMFLGGGGAPG
jgi:cytochrome c-type biogenesis protein